jgi:LuxR family maltose regulon positive regulatory protein
MAQLLREAASHGVMPAYTGKLLSAFEAEKRKSEGKPDLPATQPLIEQLSQRELKILQLIAQGLSNREIGEKLFLALDTIKGHNRIIFDKLHVQCRAPLFPIQLRKVTYAPPICNKSVLLHCPA